MKYADLHVHTFYSDSTFSPEEVIKCAHDRALSGVAISDHDCVDGIGEAKKAGSQLDIEVIPAVELTSEYEGMEIHLLGYFIDWQAPWLDAKLKWMQDCRNKRIYEMVKKLESLGVKIEAENVFKLAGKGSAGRPHIARALIQAGKVRSVSEAFERYLGPDKPCNVPNVRFSAEESIRMILKAGGVPVFGHPAVMGKDEFIPELISYGLKGLEVYHSDHRPSVVRRYEDIAKKYKLFMTGGSDCHGFNKGKILLGGVRVPYDIVEGLRKESERVRSEER
jgi:predicted metal-dependent phosphoesterase TrpH